MVVSVGARAGARGHWCARRLYEARECDVGHHHPARHRQLEAARSRYAPHRPPQVCGDVGHTAPTPRRAPPRRQPHSSRGRPRPMLERTDQRYRAASQHSTCMLPACIVTSQRILMRPGNCNDWHLCGFRNAATDRQCRDPRERVGVRAARRRERDRRTWLLLRRRPPCRRAAQYGVDATDALAIPGRGRPRGRVDPRRSLPRVHVGLELVRVERSAYRRAHLLLLDRVHAIIAEHPAHLVRYVLVR